MKSNLQLSIIIVHYKTFALTQRCLQSIYAHSGGIPIEIIIVDNDSRDGAGEKLTAEFPQITWMYNSKNEGFGRANNLGAKNARAEYLLFLNSDIQVLEKTIEQCLKSALEIPNLGVLGPKLLNEDGSVQASTYHYVAEHQGILKDNLVLDKLLSFKKPPFQAVMGSFMLIPRTVFETVGGFDPDFFMYCEEIDLCKRIKNQNKKIVFLESAIAIHKHGGSAEGSNWIIRQSFLSRSLLVYKQRGTFHFAISHFIYWFNFSTNFLFMWWLDKNYRRDFWKTFRCYFSNSLKYWAIPFTFTRSLGKGKKILKSA